jgi:hypothetical protein
VATICHGDVLCLIYCLFSRYVACQLTQGSGDQQAMGFALFETAAMAVAAKDALQVSLIMDKEIPWSRRSWVVWLVRDQWFMSGVRIE